MGKYIFIYLKKGTFKIYKIDTLFNSEGTEQKYISIKYIV